MLAPTEVHLSKSSRSVVAGNRTSQTHRKQRQISPPAI